MSVGGTGQVIPYAPPAALPYLAGTRPFLGGEGARGFPQTFLSVRATNAADRGAATLLPRCGSFSIAPAANPVAGSGRAVAAGSFPVTAYISDASGSEIAPALIITGPQVFRFGAQCNGIRLESSALAAGVDYAYDVTLDPDPAGSWDAPAGPGSYPFRQLVIGAVASPSVPATEFLNPGWAQHLAVWMRNPNAAVALSIAQQIMDPDGTYPSVQDNTALTAIGVGGRINLVCLFGAGVAAAPVGLTSSNPVISGGLAPRGIKISGTGAMDAGKSYRIIVEWGA